jgi:lactobin A/cerein 7B family class IIb bacteriocin
MKNLNEMNLTELNSKEQNETEGGFAPLIVIALLALAGCDGCLGSKKREGADQIEQ